MLWRNSPSTHWNWWSESFDTQKFKFFEHCASNLTPLNSQPSFFLSYNSVCMYNLHGHLNLISIFRSVVSHSCNIAYGPNLIQGFLRPWALVLHEHACFIFQKIDFLSQRGKYHVLICPHFVPRVLS